MDIFENYTLHPTAIEKIALPSFLRTSNNSELPGNNFNSKLPDQSKVTHL